MDWVITPYVVAMGITAVISAMVGLAAWRYRQTPGGLPIVLMLLAIAQWSAATAVELAAVGVPAKIFWSKIEYLGLVYTPVWFLIFALEYSRQTKWLKRRTIALLCIIPTITLLLAFTNEWHHLIWTNFTPSPAGNNLLVYGHGIGIWVAAVYYYLLVLAGTVALIRSALRSSHLYRRQAIVILIASILPWVGNMIYMLDLSPAPGVDVSIISFAVTASLLAVNMFHFRMLDLMPIARDALVESMSDGVMVLDAQDRIVDLNPAALRLFGRDLASMIGQPVQAALAPWGKWVDQFLQVAQTQIEFVTDHIPPRYLDLRISTLRDRRVTGRLIVLRDITELKNAEQELKQRLTELTTINAISQVLASQTDLDAMITATGEKVREILNAQCVYISLYDAQANTISTPYWRIRNQVIESPILPFGEGLITLVIRTRQPLVINQDYERRSMELGAVHVPRIPDAGLPKSWLGVPMLVENQAIGIISAQNYDRENAFSEDDVRLWTTIAANVGIAIRNAQLYSETNHYAEQMSALNRISLAVTEGLEMERLLPTLHEQCKQIAPVDVFYVSLFDQATHLLHVPYFDEHDGRRMIAPRDIRENPGLTGHVIQTCKTLYLPDTLDPSSPLPVPIIRTGGKSARAYVGVPLILRDRVVGVMSMQSYQPNAYTPQQIRLFEMFAVQVAIVVQNSQFYEEVQRLAITDELTGLPNRRMLFENGESEIKRAERFKRPLAVVMLDIDHFKLVNDQYGHGIGDRVLQDIAETFRHLLRNIDTAARYGGEEFVVLLPETDGARAARVAERLRESIEKGVVMAGEAQVRVTVSLGVAVLDKDTPNFSKLISHADRALYWSKNSGRNCVSTWTWNGDTR